MKILGIDTSTSDTSVAVTGAGAPVELRAGPEPGGRPRHVETLLPQVESAVFSAGGWKEIELVAVGTGPGTYTGLRIGIATARAIAQGQRLPIAGIGSLDGLLRGIGELGEARDRPRLGALDARRGEFFAALEDRSEKRVWQPFVARPEELVTRIETLDAPPLAAGDGALRFRHELEAAGATVPADREPVHRIAARHLCELAEASEPVPPEQVQPIYLRAPDAEVWLERDRDDNKN
jgi:tRNA threonylcarbamoyladenosine biosynthesis protein TsaB